MLLCRYKKRKQTERESGAGALGPWPFHEQIDEYLCNSVVVNPAALSSAGVVVAAGQSDEKSR